MDIYSSKFSILSFIKERNILIQTWKNKTKKIDDKLFAQEMRQLQFAINKYSPKLLLINMLRFFYIVDNETQIWVNKNVNKTIIEQKIKKTAFVISPNIETIVSVEQTLSENQSKSMNLKYFKTIHEAEEWLNKKEASLFDI